MSSPPACLTGAAVRISISEPWEFETQVGTGVLTGRVQGVRNPPDDGVLVLLDHPVDFDGKSLSCVIAEARYEGERATELVTRRDIVCAFRPVEAVQGIETATPMDLPHLIGGLHIVDQTQR